MMSDVKTGLQIPGQLIIYPQGTRVAPGVKKPYKVGTAVIYAQLGQPCVPVGTNVGLFWPKRGILRHPGLSNTQFMDELERAVETSSDALQREAGFTA